MVRKLSENNERLSKSGKIVESNILDTFNNDIQKILDLINNLVIPTDDAVIGHSYESLNKVKALITSTINDLSKLESEAKSDNLTESFVSGDGYSVKQISMDVAIKGDTITGTDGSAKSHGLYDALDKFLETHGLLMVGTFINVEDMTKEYEEVFKGEGGIKSLFEEE